MAAVVARFGGDEVAFSTPEEAIEAARASEEVWLQTSIEVDGEGRTTMTFEWMGSRRWAA